MMFVSKLTTRQCCRVVYQFSTKAAAADWSKWEFGTFATKTCLKSSEQAKRLNNLYNHKPKISNSDVQLWPNLSDEEVVRGINVLRPFCSDDRLAKLLSVLNKRTNHIRMVFEHPRNPNNVWAALRTFDSFGVQHVDVIVDSSNFNPTKKHSMVEALGAQKWLTLTQHIDTQSCVDTLKQQGYRIIASDLHANSKRIQDIDWTNKLTDEQIDAQFDEQSDNNNNCSVGTKFAIVMGTEETGITDTMRAAADELFYIPMKGFAESFNLSAASAIIMAFLDAQNALRPSMPSGIKIRMQLTWMARSVEASMPLLRQAGLPVEGVKPPYEKICGVSSK